jgi:MFS family permease
MIAFLPLSIPISWLIDTIGFKFAVSIGAVLMGISGIARGLAGANYTLVLISTIGLAVAQPFMMNSWTKAAANWFGPQERATAVGLVILANLVGTALGMVLPPAMTGIGIANMQLVFGGIAAVTALLFVLLASDKPVTPPCPPEMEERSLMLDGLKHAIRQPGFWMYATIWFLGMGVFNGISTWVEGIIKPRGFTSSDAGTMGAMLILGGLIGAVAIPALSDRSGKRVPFLRLGMFLSIPGLIVLSLTQVTWLLHASAFLFGFFLISTSPVGMQYVAEVTYPTPEGTSNGLIQLVGQASVVFVYIMEDLKTGSGDFLPAMLLCVAMILIGALITLWMKDIKKRAVTN